jgi:EAL domain-containing protein (putative c-di-GMP-specific phosphodiesterase class I)/GGDEF domain-containing protein
VSAIDAYAGFMRAAEAALADRLPHATVGVLHVHVRRIRQVRTVFGFGFGDRLLTAVARRMRGSLRPGDEVVHIDDGDFLVLLPALIGPQHGQLAADRILREFEAPLAIDRDSILVPMAIGAAFGPIHGIDADTLARRASAAVDRALSGGRHLVVADEWREDPLLLDDLRQALLSNEFSIAFQPVVSIGTGSLVGVEALARWSHPSRGMVAPSWFVPLAEQAGLAPELTRWSLNAALREFARLHRLRPELRCSVNLSSRVFADPGLAEQVTAALSIWGVPPDRLVLEVTETAVMEDPEQSAKALGRLREEGIGIALDDFGRGYSSFQYLKHLPATELKIDRVFVQIEPQDARGTRLLRSMVGLAHGLGLAVVAEGVELVEQADLLRDLGCEYAQGWHYGRPQPTNAWVERLSSANG